MLFVFVIAHELRLYFYEFNCSRSTEIHFFFPVDLKCRTVRYVRFRCSVFRAREILPAFAFNVSKNENFNVKTVI